MIQAHVGLDIGPDARGSVLPWQTVVHLENTVSTRLRTCQVPRGPICRLVGSPGFAW